MKAESRADPSFSDERRLRRHQNSPVSFDSGVDAFSPDDSSNSLKQSFHETELDSDDEKAEQQIAASHKKFSKKRANNEALKLLHNSLEELSPAARHDEERKAPASGRGMRALR